MPLDPRIILAQRPLESFADIQDRRTQREIQQQEADLRRQEIMARRDELIDRARQRNEPKPYDPLTAGHEYDLRVKQAAGVAALLEQATDPDTYEQAKQGIAQIVGPDYVQHLPATFDPAVNARLVAQGKALIAKAQTQTNPVRMERPDPDDPTKTVQTWIRPEVGVNYPVPTKSATESAGSDYHQFLARYAKSRNKTVDDLTDAEELDARGKFGRSDDAKPTTIRMANGMTPGQAFTSERQLRNDFSRETKSAQTVAQQLALMESSLAAVKAGKAGAGSQGVLVTFQKILDPTSVVRESEYARSASGLSLLGQIEGKWDQIRQGGAGVTAADLDQFVTLARAFNKNQQAFAKQTRDQINAVAKEYGLDPSRITKDTDVQTPRAESPVAPGTSAAPAKPPTNPFRK